MEAVSNRSVLLSLIMEGLQEKRAAFLKNPERLLFAKHFLLHLEKRTYINMGTQVSIQGNQGWSDVGDALLYEGTESAKYLVIHQT